MSKIGVVITTFNSENYFSSLYNSLPLDRIDELVVVNGGEPYKNEYKCSKWIQHDEVKFASVARNDGLRYLLEKECDFYFIIEDDMVITNPDIFDHYIETSKISGFEYLCYASNAWYSGPRFARTPRLQVQYSEKLAVNLMHHTCNEVTFRTKNVLEKTGLYDEKFQFMFDIDNLYRMFQDGFIDFWWFPDSAHSDNYVMNNPDAVSRMNPNGERDDKLGPDMARFITKYNIYVTEVLNKPEQIIREKLESQRK
jgi:glycosyltransferase involved in cell wall biosynthesis